MKKRIVIKGNNIIDGKNTDAIVKGCVVTEENKIIYVGKQENYQILPDDEIIEGEAIIPGLIDCHVHFCLNGEANYFQSFINSTLSTFAIQASVYAKRLLEGGFTTVRSVGEPGYMGISLRDCINHGIIPGPRIYTSGQILSITGGNADWLPQWIHSDIDLAMFSDGVEEIRKSVRKLVGSGVDFIKMLATAGVMGKGMEPGAQNYNYDEIETAVYEAHKLRKRIATHAEGLLGTKDCIKAGVDTIEHGIELDEEAIEMMKDKGTFLVPTLTAPHNINLHGVKAGIPELAVKKSMDAEKRHIKSFKKAYQAGVKIAMGTDTGTPFSRHGEGAKELELMVKQGVSPMEAIIFSTKGGSEAIGIEDKVGTIEVGKFADIVVLNDNPLDDITVLQNKKTIKAVIKNGIKEV
jgi:imidazolonepropionase-like amidohydrolase